MPIRLYNTLTRSMEEFTVAAPDALVRFYSCGPTVYDDAHIGNFRSFLNADVLRRALELHGLRVKHVMNITDVGHMTEDDSADGGGEGGLTGGGEEGREVEAEGGELRGGGVEGFGFLEEIHGGGMWLRRCQTEGRNFLTTERTERTEGGGI